MNLLEVIVVLSIIAFSASLTMPSLARMNESSKEQIEITKTLKEIGDIRIKANKESRNIIYHDIIFFPNFNNTLGEIRFKRRKVVVSKYGVVKIVRIF